MKIFLVEDDENLNILLKTYLEKESYEVVSFLRGDDALTAIGENPDLWILDIMLPGLDGYSLLRKIKEIKDTPVIFISARDADIDRVVGLEIGADDYISKPFLPRELVLRVKKLFNNKINNHANNGLLINEEKRIIEENGARINLTTKEFDLLLYLYKNKDIALSRDQILNAVWGNDYFGSDRVVDDLVRRLRNKISSLKIETIYGYGYRLNDEE
ncbi:MAG: response regulator transcription factor [Tissierellia bacterium]|nr:response regulator transcription factor [Tissierellia bacterium]